jgi:5-methylcytosine-specific restriction endonuclease McrA
MSSVLTELDQYCRDRGNWSRGVGSLPLRLQALGFASYSSYLNSPHWQSVRARYYKSRLPNRIQGGHIVCAACNGVGLLQLHHKSYKRLGAERLQDLVLLCGDCHQRIHAMNPKRKGLWTMTRRFIKRKQKAIQQHAERRSKNATIQQYEPERTSSKSSQ